MRKYSFLIIAALFFCFSMAQITYAQNQNYLPPGVTADKSEKQVFYDMYFDAEFEQIYADQLIYMVIGKNMPELKKGDYIIHGDYISRFTPYRVEEVTVEKEKVMVKVRSATVVEIQPELSVKTDLSKDIPIFTIEEMDGKVVMTTTDERFANKYKSKYPELQLLSAAKATHNVGRIAYSGTNFTVYNGTLAHDGLGEGTLNLSVPSYGFIYKPVIDLEWTSTSALVKLSTDSLSFYADAKVEITAISGKLLREKEKKIGGKASVFAVGLVAVYYDVSVWAVVKVSASANGTAQAGLQVNIPHALGASCANGTWTAINDYTFNPAMYNSANAGTHRPTYNITGTVAAEVRLEPRLSLYLYGIFGPKIIPAAYSKLDLNYSSATNFSWNAVLGIKADVEIDLGIPAIGLSGWTYKTQLFDKPLVKFPTTEAEAGLGGAACGSAGAGDEGNLPGLADEDPLVIGVATLSSPANNAYTNNLRPSFSWTAVTGATKYQFRLGSVFYDQEYVMFEPAGASFTPSVDLPTCTDGKWQVRAFVKGRYGAWSNFRKIDIGLTIGTGNSYYGRWAVGNQVIVSEPRTGANYTFRLQDYDVSLDPRQIRMNVYNSSTGVEIAGSPMIVQLNIAKKVDGVNSLFILPTNISSTTPIDIMIAPVISPDLVITQPLAGTMSGAIVQVSLAYSGKDVPWQTEASSPYVSTSNFNYFRGLSYNESASVNTNGDFTWTMTGVAGDRTMTVVMTDKFGEKISKSVTVNYVPCVATVAPVAPTFSDVDCRSITVNWTDVANEIGYQVQRSPS
ncbi:MAG: hypothetical protein KKD38_04580, partial [Candidatus Delongbacteria bacterium]|nr:hypothetical protein [Candidatus Delongbacteria bacterium]